MNDVTLIIAATMVAIAIVIVGLRGRGSSNPAVQVAPMLDLESFIAPVREQLLEIAHRLSDTSNESPTLRAELTTMIKQVLTNDERNSAEVKRLAGTTVRIATALQGVGVRADWGQTRYAQ
jgi:hypothetical protein